MSAAAGARPAAAAVPARRPLISGPFPRAFAFRQSEILANLRSYAEWEAAFRPLSGLLGKVLPDGITTTVTARNLSYFRRYKHDHPDAVVLVHYSGRARLPTYRTSGWSAADWLHFAGTAVPAATDSTATTLQVADTTGFELAVDAWGHRSADLVLTARTPDGRPDWDVAEQLVLTDVDAGSGTLTVERAAYGSTARAFDAGAYLARHVSLGPFSDVDARVWAYNLATTAPRGADGRSAAERIAAEFTADFAAGGALDRLDGVELDIFLVPASDADRPRLDADGDGIADGAYDGDIDAYVAGQVVLTQLLRAAIGPRRILSTDGGGRHRPDAADVNGIEREGFPSVSDPNLTGWSTAVDGLEYWTARAGSPRLTYPLAKTDRGYGDPVDFARFRVSLAAALMTGSAFSFWDEPEGGCCAGLLDPPDYGHFQNAFVIWDELLAGVRGTPGWLGAPLGDPVWLALGTADLLAGAGTRLPSSFVRSLHVSGATLTRQVPPALLLEPAGPSGCAVGFDLAAFGGGDLVLRGSGRCDPDPGLPASVGRNLDVEIRAGGTSRSATLTLDGDWRWFRCWARDLPPGRATVTVAMAGPGSLTLRRLTTHAFGDAGCRAFEHGAVFVNPTSAPVTFPVADLFPAATYARLTATAGQDATVNDGSPIGAELTLPARDAIVVATASTGVRR